LGSDSQWVILLLITLPPSFADFLIAHVAAKVAEKTEQNIWKGATATAGEFDGLVTLATADATVLDVASPASGGITAGNVIAELGKVVDLFLLHCTEKKICTYTFLNRLPVIMYVL
jgi:hypothetical protein